MNNSPNPKITIVLTTYRRPHLLKRAIKSVLNQTYPHFKIRVYDDASGDETEKVVSEFAKTDSRIHFHSHEKNMGWFLDNVNFGIARVDTPLWTVLSDDNLFLPNFLETAVQDLEKNPQALFCAQQVIFMTDEGKIHTVSPSNAWRSGFYTTEEGLPACIKDPSIFGGAIYRSKAIAEVGLLDRETAEVSDWDYTFRAVSRFPFVINLNPGVIFRFDTTSFSGQSQSRYTWLPWHKMLKNLTSYKGLDPTVIQSAERLLKKRLRGMLVQQGKISARAGNFKDAALAAKTLKEFFHCYRDSLYITFLNSLCRSIPTFRNALLLSNAKKSERKREMSTRNYSSYIKYEQYL
ncbi:MAG: glycosyltransferase family 2 protein [Nitrospinae bacterium]|nr:glycosyltransferase family 2 protein [Nitrospinota bacterium]MDA1110880.1 glycosyltransferase family 2 protein [Nitrospinota bacterium]